ncbi:MAG TPA: PEGA domain-containing protein [Kofleriaceae bacterium]|nr:PEGA domain-containing protein [Kofleriaceae bacterium]
MNRAALALALSTAFLWGCATIVAGGPDTIPITTNPPGAYVYVNGQVVGQTPMMVELDRSRSMADIRIYYPGFQPIQVMRYKTLNGWIFGNFFLAIFPVIVDFATDNWQRFDDEPIAIGLTPGQAPPPYGTQPMLPQQPMPPPR